MPTKTRTITVPTHIACLRLETKVDTVSPDIEDNYSTRYVSDAVREKVNTALDVLGDESEEQSIINNVLASVEFDADCFYSVTGAQDNDSFDGIESGWTTDNDGIGTFVDSHIGYSLSELLSGVPYEGGIISVDLDELTEANAEGGLISDDEDWDYSFIQSNASRYILQEGSNFVLQS